MRIPQMKIQRPTIGEFSDGAIEVADSANHKVSSPDRNSTNMMEGAITVEEAMAMLTKKSQEEMDADERLEQFEADAKKALESATDENRKLLCSIWVAAQKARAAYYDSLANFNTVSEEDKAEKLDARRIELKNPPEKPVPVVTLKGRNVSTAGNLTVLAAQAKAGKSACIGGIFGAMVAADLHRCGTKQKDFLGFDATKTTGKAVLLFDSEQSQYDSFLLVKRAVDRAEVNELPENFRAFRLLDVPTKQRKELIAFELTRAAEAFGGIHAVILDGIGDLCNDLNDQTEAFGLVDEWLTIAGKYECPIITVLHENPGNNEFGKTRGHLGSHLTRKAESNLRITKESKTDVSVIWSDNSRSMNLPKEQGQYFRYDEILGRHVSVASDEIEDKKEERKEAAKEATKARKAEEKRNELRSLCMACFGTFNELSYSELIRRIMDEDEVSEKTAERRLTNMKVCGFVENHRVGFYRNTIKEAAC